MVQGSQSGAVLYGRTWDQTIATICVLPFANCVEARTTSLLPVYYLSILGFFLAEVKQFDLDVRITVY